MSQEIAVDFGPTLDYSRSKLGTFRIVDRLAGGGMASVYLGCRLSARGAMELAAVKVMLPELSHDPDYVEMFLDEIRLTSAVRHPGAARVLEHGVEGAHHYLTTEYLFGETWSDLVGALHKCEAARPILQPLLLSILIQVCDALHAVHETRDESGKHLSIVHRDVCPNNLMVCYDGNVKVVDFGIATACERLHQTRDGVLKGHIGYMPPEQVRGLKVDRRGDLWPIGVLLWEGVTGRRLFKRDNSRATIHAIATDSLEPVLSLDTVIPAPLRSVIGRAIERDLDRRFATAQELGDALRAACPPGELLQKDEIAAWMQRLFEERFTHRCKELKRKAARLTDGTDAHRTDDSPLVGIGHDRMRGRLPRSDRPGTTNIRVAVVGAARSAARTIEMRVRRSPHRSGMFGVLLVVAALGCALVLQSRANPTEPARSPQADAALRAALSAPPSTLSIRSERGEVFVELSGKSLGKTPLTVDVPPGHHVARVRTSDEDVPAVAELELASGQRYELLVENLVPR